MLWRETLSPKATTKRTEASPEAWVDPGSSLLILVWDFLRNHAGFSSEQGSRCCEVTTPYRIVSSSS